MILEQNDAGWIFVFGSNLRGRHGKGAAVFAAKRKGAVEGLGEGLSGNSYALPTKDEHIKTLPLERIVEHVDRFKAFAASRPDLVFQVTKVGCGLAGLDETLVAAMFSDAPQNCLLPGMWRGSLGRDVSPAIIVAGSRSFSDRDTMFSKLDNILSRLASPVIISGGAQGADSMGEEYAKARGLSVERFPARWKLPDGSTNKSAGFERNTLMAWRGTHLVAFWDGVSNGTRHMIDTAKKEGLAARVISFVDNGPKNQARQDPGSKRPAF